MKYFSELTKKIYDSEEELNNAEIAFQEQLKAEEKEKLERQEAAKNVDNLYSAYQTALTDFLKKYGSYHKTIRKNDVSLLDLFFNDWNW